MGQNRGHSVFRSVGFFTSFASGVLYAGVLAAAPAKVACVGDSITFGFSEFEDVNPYPAQLQDLLGEADYTVGNFGQNGTAVQKGSDNPYWDSDGYPESTAFEPNLVVIMLGTNDVRLFNWEDPSASQTAFVRDYKDLIAVYRDLGANVLVATPPPVYGEGGFDISPELLNGTIVDLVRQIASETDAPLVDVHTALSGHAANFPDNVHPDTEGAGMIAETVYGAITQTGVGGSGGSAGRGGSGGRAGAGAGGRAGAAGRGGTGGVAMNGGSSGTGGTSAEAGAPSRGGSGGRGGTGNTSPGTGGGSAASGGASMGGGVGGSGGQPAEGSAGSDDGGSASNVRDGFSESAGCSCRLRPRVPASALSWTALFLLLPISLRRRLTRRQGGAPSSPAE